MSNVFENLREKFFPRDNYDEYYDEPMEEEYDDYEEEPSRPRRKTAPSPPPPGHPRQKCTGSPPAPAGVSGAGYAFSWQSPPLRSVSRYWI